jgi:putative ABC transport system permease protein
MRDIAAYVRRHLPRGTISDDHYDKVVEELTDELEARYTSSLQSGASEADAWGLVLAQVPSWSALAEALSDAAPRAVAKPESRFSATWLRALAPERWLQDIRVGLRALAKDRVYAVTAVLTFGICLGGNAAIIPAVNAILLNPLPVPEPERVVLMANQYPKVESRPGRVTSPPDYLDRLQSISALEEQALYNYAPETIDSGGVPTRMLGIIATPSLLRVLHVEPSLGRNFSEDEGRLGNEQRVILSDGLWRELYGGDPTAIGRTLRLTGREFTIVGVLPRGFSFGGNEVRFWIPLALTERQRAFEARQSNGWFNVGRLNAGASIEQVRDQLKAIDAANLDRFPQLKPLLTSLGFYTSAEPLQDALVRNVKGPLTMLWVAALGVLAIGVANVGHLAFARSRLRLHEFATRLAVGAKRGDIVRQHLVEAWLVASAGIAAGVAVGVWINAAMQSSRIAALQNAPTDSLDAIVILATSGLGVLVATFIGLISALPVLTMPLGRMIKEEARGARAGGAARTVRRMLVVAQVACSFVLLVGAGLLWVSVRTLLATDLGFRTDNVVTGSVSLPRQRYSSDDDARAFVGRSLQEIRRLPGVVAAGASTIVPLSGSYSSGPLMAEGYVPQPGEPPVGGTISMVTPGYFEATGTPLVRGRYFDERDTPPTATTIVVDERIAQKFWGGGDPIGKRVARLENLKDWGNAQKARWFTIVGVVRHTRLRGIEAPDDLGNYYLPYSVRAPRDFGLVIRTAVDPTTIVGPLRTTLASMDREVALADVRTLLERTELSLSARSTTMRLASLFAIVALVLAAVGLYGVLTYLVTRRTHEIGIRVAIGSTPAGIMGLVLREGLGLALGGIMLGVVIMLGLGRLFSSYLYGVAPRDPLVMTLVALGLASIGLVACVYPARRAARVDAIQVLHSL